MSLPSPVSDPQSDRRVNHRVREVFVEACTLITPFFAKENRWGNTTLDHLAYRVLREHYPELSFEEVYVLVVAAHRVYASTVRDGKPETY